MENNFKICEIESVECIGEFEDEYVYDIEMCPDTTESIFFANDILIHNSNFISLKCLEQKGIFCTKDGVVTPEFYDTCQEFEDFMNVRMKEWAIKFLNSSDPRLVFSRESICEKGILLGKKYYVLFVNDSEGNVVNTFKYKGVDVVKATMAKQLKPDVKNIIEIMISTMSLEKTNKAFNDLYDKFKSFDIKEISNINSVNDYEKYCAKANGFETAKATPIHVKAAYFHDLMIEKLGVANKYQKFASGDKVRRVYLKTPNKYGLPVIAFKDKFPPEFLEVFEVDYEKQFTKILFAAIERFYIAVGWRLRKPSENVKCEILDLFSL